MGTGNASVSFMQKLGQLNGVWRDYVRVDGGLLCGTDKFGISTLILAGAKSPASLN